MWSLLLWHQTALCSSFWHRPHHVKRCCKESLRCIIHLMPGTLLTDSWHHWQPFERNLHPAERFGSVITALNLSLVFKNDTLSNLPVRVIAKVMNVLWLSLARKHYFPSSDNVAICWKREMFCSACHVLYMLRHPPPHFLLIHLAFCYRLSTAKWKLFALKGQVGVRHRCASESSH